MGTNLKLSLFGESHGEAIGITIEGLPSGIKIDLDYLKSQLDLRKPKGKISTKRQEKDDFNIVSGFFGGFTTGTPLTFLIYNENTNSSDYTPENLRPSHADFTAYVKYNGFQDYRGGGHFSGRITAPLVLAGAVALQVLKDRGVIIGSHIKKCKDILDDNFSDNLSERTLQIEKLNKQYIATISDEKQTEMLELMEKASEDGDSLGGILETAVLGLEAGIGEPFFDSLESHISRMLFSIPAVKGVSFGLGFDFSNYYGSEVNDSFYCENNEIKTKTNYNGGINGGISNGMPIIVNTVIKPTPSIYKEQETVNFDTKENINHIIKGRHDPCIVHRARVVVDSAIALSILDLCMSKYGHNI